MAGGKIRFRPEIESLKHIYMRMLTFKFLLSVIVVVLSQIEVRISL